MYAVNIADTITPSTTAGITVTSATTATTTHVPVLPLLLFIGGSPAVNIAASISLLLSLSTKLRLFLFYLLSYLSSTGAPDSFGRVALTLFITRRTSRLLY